MIKPGEEETPAARPSASARSSAADSNVRRAVGPGVEAID